MRPRETGGVHETDGECGKGVNEGSALSSSSSVSSEALRSRRGASALPRSPSLLRRPKLAERLIALPNDAVRFIMSLFGATDASLQPSTRAAVCQTSHNCLHNYLFLNMLANAIKRSTSTCFHAPLRENLDRHRVFGKQKKPKRLKASHPGARGLATRRSQCEHARGLYVYIYRQLYGLHPGITNTKHVLIFHIR